LRCSADASAAATQAKIATQAIIAKLLMIFINQTPHRILARILRQRRCNRQKRMETFGQTLLIEVNGQALPR
jgi:hypothetical protein